MCVIFLKDEHVTEFIYIYTQLNYNLLSKWIIFLLFLEKLISFEKKYNNFYETNWQ